MSIRNFCYLFIFCFIVSAIALANTIVPPVIVRALQPIEATKKVITSNDITIAGTSSVYQTLRELGGLQLQNASGSPNQAAISIRGFGGNASYNSLLLVNGIPITNPDLASPNLNIVPLSEIKSLTIISGSESVQYGDQAVGGIVNIITKNISDDKFDLAASLGSYNQYILNSSINKHTNTYEYYLGLLKNHTDNYRKHNDYDENALTGRFYYPYQNGSLNFFANLAQEYLLYPGALTATQVANNRRQANNTTDFFNNWNGFYILHQQQYINNGWHIQNDLTRREMHGHGVLFSSFTQSRVIHFLKSQIEGKIGRAQVTSGFNLESDFYDLTSAFGESQDSQQKYSIYSWFNIPIGLSNNLIIGGRAASQHNNLKNFIRLQSNNSVMVSTAGLNHRFNSQISAYIRRAGSYRFPKADEDANGDNPKGLNTQTGVSYETGLNWQSSSSLGQFSLYQLNLKNEIAFDPMQTASHPFGTNKNLTPTTRHGFSISEKYKINENLALNAQYNFVNARFHDGPYSGKRIPLVAEQIFQTSIEYKIRNRWTAYTEALFTGNEYPDNDYTNVLSKIGGYVIYNMNLQFEYKNFIGNLRLNNIFNKYYYNYTVYQPSQQHEKKYYLN